MSAASVASLRLNRCFHLYEGDATGQARGISHEGNYSAGSVFIRIHDRPI